MQNIINLINHYGYIILFVSLALELIAFPFPGEFMMTYFGFLVYQAQMNWLISIFVAASGAITGITMSYLIGRRLGAGFFKKYGHYFHLGPGRLEKTSEWFKRYGNKLLLLAYFIPGVRHITGYFSGITEISYKKFAITAYLGAVLWSATFVSLGKVLGANWDKFHTYITRYLIIGSISIGIVVIIVYLIKNNSERIVEFASLMLNKALKSLQSLRKIKAVIIFAAAAFLGFFILLIGVIQDYLAHEFEQFDIIVSYLAQVIFTEKWSQVINNFRLLTSIEILIPLTLSIVILIIRKYQNRKLELKFLFTVVCGSELLQYALRYIFRRLGPSTVNSIYTFPSSETLTVIAVYGFYAYIIIRHVKKTWLRPLSVITAIAICIFAGIPPLFYQTEYPSDVYAGYIFGGVWVSINIILLEIYRILPGLKPRNN